MLTLTPQAQEKLIEALKAHTKDPKMAIRICLNPTRPKRLDLVLDKEKKGDCILKTIDGVKVLVIQSQLATKLEGLLLDYEEIIEDFVISEMTRH
jgi:Fe-S cluster assembly iron-binding protein IscA